jgi:hypothetical protein
MRSMMAERAAMAIERGELEKDCFTKKRRPRRKKKAMFRCMECGRAVRGRKCSRCGSYDIDLA